MPRKLQPCGTPAAYRRHLRGGEKPCLPCARAHAKAKEDRAAKRRADEAPVQLNVVADVTAADDGDIDPLQDARDNLAEVREAMKSAVPREVAALSKRRQELVALIVELGGKKEVSLADQLAAARAEREARRSGA
ncbi:MAG: hypothetical protein CMH34_09900 [Microbacterium sp.]|nr:hypothetical protein [Microbacterium sp.]